MKPFQFKQFSIAQDKNAMKVGTDGVLLGAWCPSNGNTVLDIGTGTGLIALMLAQRNTTAKIDALEIDENAFEEANTNFNNSPWSDRLNIVHSSIQNFEKKNQYDLIVCNPPFFIDSTKAPNNERNMARHTDELPFLDLIGAVKRLLSQTGKFALILPVIEALIFTEHAQANELYLNRKCEVKPNLNKPAKRVLMEFSFSKSSIIEEQLTIETEERHKYTKDYITLTKDFYLNL